MIAGWKCFTCSLIAILFVAAGRQLFKRAVMLSGSGLSAWAISRHPIDYVRQLTIQVNCSEHWGNTERLLRCLHELPFRDLVDASIDTNGFSTRFGPVHDNNFLPYEVDTLASLTMSDFGSIDLLVGMTTADGATYLDFSEKELEGIVSEGKERQLVEKYVRSFEHGQFGQVSDLLEYLYRAWPAPLNMRSVVDLVTDAQFAAPLIQLLQRHTPHTGATYFYCFNYPTITDSSPWCTYGDDMAYLFGAPLSDNVTPFASEYTRSQRLLSRAFMTYVGNFIKTGHVILSYASLLSPPPCHFVNCIKTEHVILSYVSLRRVIL